MRRWTNLVTLAVMFALTIYLTSYISGLPESNCTTDPVVSSWSHDQAYEATLLRKDCNLGETVFYSVRVDKPGAWFLRMEIEQGSFPDQAIEPSMKWDAHKLQIDIPAGSFSGAIERREGDLTVVRSYTRPKS
jgi:hypothetical protein